jgi:hypothetical protein
LDDFEYVIPSSVVAVGKNVVIPKAILQLKGMNGMKEQVTEMRLTYSTEAAKNQALHMNE